jgi:GT2 family glycosyltransferase/glycosyltransferase involved in cell wall biosynthesis
MRCVATDMGMVATSPMARPRRFAIAAAALAGQTGLLHVVGPDGRDLPGSPLDPHADSLAGATVAAAMAEAAPWIRNGRARRRIDPRLLAVPADLVGPPARGRRDPARRLAVVVPVYRDRALTLACLAAIRATAPPGTYVIVVDDATPEPELAAALDALAAEGAIRLLRHPRNRGFPAAANAGLRAAARLASRPDVVLLNSDALLTAGALAALRDLVHAAPNIGTATPLSNDATILSYPDRAGGAPAPEGPARARLARLAAQANAGRAVDIPTAVGFCMYVRRECLAEVGLFREDVFAQGYGEENDFCLRARHLGWRHVAAPGVFVSHVGGRSFGASRHALIARNLAVLERLHPGYHALIAAHQAADPLAPARRRLDMLRWRAARAGSGAASTILVTHDSGGGVERVVRRRCEELRAARMRPIVLRPVLDPAASSADAKRHLPGLVELCDGVDHAYPNLRFAIPGELDALARLLRADRPVALEIHHLLGHDHAILQLASRLGVPHDIHLHDYAWFCPRITLLGAGGRYCGEPEDPATCEACIADLGRHDEQDIAVAALRARSAVDLGGARGVIAPSADAASRLRRHFPSVRARVAPLEDDAALPPATALHPAAGRRRVGVIGGIGPEKGYDILLACARDAARRGLDLEFVVIGHTVDDARLHATGRVFVTGPYRDELAVEEIRAQAVDLAFLPSIWPETWCFTLGHAWAAGLRAFAFDIGAPAARIRETGRGWVLPLGLPPAAINNALLAARAVAGDECRVAGPA